MDLVMDVQMRCVRSLRDPSGWAAGAGSDGGAGAGSVGSNDEDADAMCSSWIELVKEYSGSAKKVLKRLTNLPL